MLEDEIALTGQGRIAVRSNEHLGRSDRGVFLLRKIWERELRNLAEGRLLKAWQYPPEMVPTYPEDSPAGRFIRFSIGFTDSRLKKPSESFDWAQDERINYRNG